MWLGLGLVWVGGLLCGAGLMMYFKNRECSLYLEAVNRSWDGDFKRLEGSKRLVVYSRDGSHQRHGDA